MTFPKTSTNRLLLACLAFSLPAQAIISWPLHAPGPGLLVWPISWITLRHLNRRAWRRHFTPRARR